MANRGALLASGILACLSLAAKRKLIRLPISTLTDEYAFSYGPDGWHYFRALLAEYERNRDVDPEQTSFYRFFCHERVRSIRYLEDVLFLHDEDRRAPTDGFRFYFGTYPWGGWGKDEGTVGGKPWGHHYDRVEKTCTRDLFGFRRNPWYQPGDTYPLDIEWNQTIKLYHSLLQGYFPLAYGTLPSVVLLVRRNGAIRAVRRNGNHRLSILSHLGRKSVTVWIAPDSIEVVREADVDQWYYVERGLCSREHALDVFNAFFDLTGRERIEYLGLPTVN
jgi:hypothetical protein